MRKACEQGQPDPLRPEDLRTRAGYTDRPTQRRSGPSTVRRSWSCRTAASSNAQITVNGHDVVAPQDFRVNGELVVPLSLKSQNSIEVRSRAGQRRCAASRDPGDPGRSRTPAPRLLRAEHQRHGPPASLLRHFGLQGRNLPGRAGDEHHVRAVALGFRTIYLIYVALTSLEDPPVPPFVETVQFRGDSYRDEPPYANLNHIGMAYATYSTTDLDSAFAYLQAKGVAICFSTDYSAQWRAVRVPEGPGRHVPEIGRGCRRCRSDLRAWSGSAGEHEHERG